MINTLKTNILSSYVPGVEEELTRTAGDAPMRGHCGHFTPVITL